MSDAPRAIVAGHGDFAAGILSAVEQISGRADRFVAISNAGLSPAGLADAFRAALQESGARIIFTDLPAGSCTMAARRIAHTEPDLIVVTGVALPTILSFACGADLDTAVERGRESLAQIEGPRGA